MIMSSNQQYQQQQVLHDTNSLLRNHHQASTSTSPSTSASISTSINNNNNSFSNNNSYNNNDFKYNKQINANINTFNSDLNNNVGRSHQLSSNSSNSLSSLYRRKPAPEIAAPKEPTRSKLGHNFLVPTSKSVAIIQNKTNNTFNNQATQTLNRLQFSQRRRNLSFKKEANDNDQNEPVYWKPDDNLVYKRSGQTMAKAKAINDPTIYAPASIAGFPRHDNENFVMSHNFGARRAPSAASGRESSIASLFGSIRRKSLRNNWFSSISRRRNKRRAWLFDNQQSIYSNTSVINGYNLETPVGFDGDANIEEDIYANCKNGQLKAEHIYAEGLRAIDGNYLSRSKLNNRLDIGQTLNPGETRWIILDEEQTNYLQLIGVLRNWLNDLLASDRIIVIDLQEDLYDGQIFVKLFEKLQKVKLDLIEVTQNEELQKQRLSIVLGQINRLLTLNARWARLKWSVDGIHSKSMPEILHLLIFLAIYYRAPIKIPANVAIRAVEISKSLQANGQVKHRSHLIQLTKTYETSLDDDADNNNNNNNNSYNQDRTSDMFADVDKATSLGQLHTESHRVNPKSLLQSSNATHKDVFDELIDNVDVHCLKLNNVCQLLVRFANRHLNKINMSCNSMIINANLRDKSVKLNAKSNQAQVIDPNQFSDGLLLVFLISSLENYFVPLGNLYTGSNTNSFAVNTNQSDQSSSKPINNTTTYIDNTITAIQGDSYTNTHPLSKLHNVNVALQLIEESGIEDIRKLVKPEEIVNGNLKAILRILYSLFSHYRHL